MASPLPDWYAVLGVPPTASSDEIRQAFRQAALRLHPDKAAAAAAAAAAGGVQEGDPGGANAGSVQAPAAAAEEYRKVQQAWEVSSFKFICCRILQAPAVAFTKCLLLSCRCAAAVSNGLPAG